MSNIESLLFVSGEDGLTKKQLAFLTSETEEIIAETLETMMASYKKSEDRGIEIKQLAGTYQLVTKQINATSIQKLVENPTTQSLSQASLEVLAIIAYKQPITRVEIEEIRGVKSERPIHTLSLKGLVKEVGVQMVQEEQFCMERQQNFFNTLDYKILVLYLHYQKRCQWMKWKTRTCSMTKFQETFEG